MDDEKFLRACLKKNIDDQEVFADHFSYLEARTARRSSSSLKKKTFDEILSKSLLFSIPNDALLNILNFLKSEVDIWMLLLTCKTAWNTFDSYLSWKSRILKRQVFHLYLPVHELFSSASRCLWAMRNAKTLRLNTVNEAGKIEYIDTWGDATSKSCQLPRFKFYWIMQAHKGQEFNRASFAADFMSLSSKENSEEFRVHKYNLLKMLFGDDRHLTEDDIRLGLVCPMNDTERKAREAAAAGCCSEMVLQMRKFFQLMGTDDGGGRHDNYEFLKLRRPAMGITERTWIKKQALFCNSVLLKLARNCNTSLLLAWKHTIQEEALRNDVERRLHPRPWSAIAAQLSIHGFSTGNRGTKSERIHRMLQRIAVEAAQTHSTELSPQQFWILVVDLFFTEIENAHESYDVMTCSVLANMSSIGSGFVLRDLLCALENRSSQEEADELAKFPLLGTKQSIIEAVGQGKLLNGSDWHSFLMRHMAFKTNDGFTTFHSVQGTAFSPRPRLFPEKRDATSLTEVFYRMFTTTCCSVYCTLREECENKHGFFYFILKHTMTPCVLYWNGHAWKGTPRVCKNATEEFDSRSGSCLQEGAESSMLLKPARARRAAQKMGDELSIADSFTCFAIHQLNRRFLKFDDHSNGWDPEKWYSFIWCVLRDALMASVTLSLNAYEQLFDTCVSALILRFPQLATDVVQFVLEKRQKDKEDNERRQIDKQNSDEFDCILHKYLTPHLFLALSYNGHFDTIAYFLKKGVDLFNRDYQTKVLFLAAVKDNTAIVAHGIRENWAFGVNVFKAACGAGETCNVLRLLLQFDAHKSDIWLENQAELEAILFQGDKKCLHCALEAGALSKKSEKRAFMDFEPRISNEQHWNKSADYKKEFDKVAVYITRHKKWAFRDNFD